MKTLIMILMAIVMTAGNIYGQTDSQAPPVPAEEKPEVLTRGPVNEAFAQPVNIDEDSDFTAPKAPPPDIEETPPEERPVGNQFAWVPGYWAWDTDLNDYIWVSGCWRAVPPGKYWVPGYWTEFNDGWRWVAGFWAPVSEDEIEYLPAPPAVTYVDPPATEYPDKIWVPPCWYWNNGYYTLRSGYWIEAREDWVWVPSHYVWTPRGYVFVGGHWDYPFRRRGLLFAPVYFPGHFHWRAGFSYSLSIAVDLGNLEFGIFTRPSYRHYYFGDYYDSFYIGIGIYPWFECVSRHTWYDPIYLHDRWLNRRHYPNWWQHERNEYARRRDDRRLRPPRTYREMDRRVRTMTEPQRRNFEVAAPINRIVERRETNFRFRKDKPKARAEISREANDVQRYAKERRQWESTGAVPRTNREVTRGTPSGYRRETKKSGEYQKNEINKLEQRGVSKSVRERSSGAPATGRDSLTPSNHIANPSNAPQRQVVRKKSESVNVKRAPVERQKNENVQRRAYKSVRERSSEAPATGRDSLTRSNHMANPSNAPQRQVVREKSETVKVKSSPVVDKKKGVIFRKRAPSQPDEEKAEREGNKSRSKRR